MKKLFLFILLALSIKANAGSAFGQQVAPENYGHLKKVTLELLAKASPKMNLSQEQQSIIFPTIRRAWEVRLNPGDATLQFTGKNEDMQGYYEIDVHTDAALQNITKIEVVRYYRKITSNLDVIYYAADRFQITAGN